MTGNETSNWKKKKKNFLISWNLNCRLSLFYEHLECSQLLQEVSFSSSTFDIKTHIIHTTMQNCKNVHEFQLNPVDKNE